MPDIEIRCLDCKNTFLFTEGEQSYYQQREFTPPKRCKFCRDARKQQRDGGNVGSGPRPEQYTEPQTGGGGNGGGGRRGRGDDYDDGKAWRK